MSRAIRRFLPGFAVLVLAANATAAVPQMRFAGVSGDSSKPAATASSNASLVMAESPLGQTQPPKKPKKGSGKR